MDINNKVAVIKEYMEIEEKKIVSNIKTERKNLDSGIDLILNKYYYRKDDIFELFNECSSVLVDSCLQTRRLLTIFRENDLVQRNRYYEAVLRWTSEVPSEANLNSFIRETDHLIEKSQKQGQEIVHSITKTPQICQVFDSNDDIDTLLQEINENCQELKELRQNNSNLLQPFAFGSSIKQEDIDRRIDSVYNRTQADLLRLNVLRDSYMLSLNIHRALSSESNNIMESPPNRQSFTQEEQKIIELCEDLRKCVRDLQRKLKCFEVFKLPARVQKLKNTLILNIYREYGSRRIEAIGKLYRDMMQKERAIYGLFYDQLSRLDKKQAKELETVYADFDKKNKKAIDQYISSLKNKIHSNIE